jgi:hypothetical protein
MRPGDVIGGRYVVEAPAGSGGMADVLRARDRETGATVALKILRGRTPELVERFAREADVLSRLSHPGIVRFIDRGVTPGGEPFIVMEWLRGDTLAARLERADLTVAEAIAVAARLAGITGAVHAAGLVHRDLKPANVFVCDGDLARLMLLDLGIVRVSGADGPTRTGAFLGTPRYMAPEQVRGERDLDARVDVYALGCILFQCLTRRLPFDGEHAIAVMAKVLLEEAPPVDQLRPEVPRGVADLVARMLAKSRAQRPADGAAVAAELDAVSRRGTSASPHARALTLSERRVLSLIMAGKTTGRDTTAPAGASAPTASSLREVLSTHGARLELVAGGAFLASFVSTGAATDQAASAARAALALSVLEKAPVVIATGHAEVSAGGLAGEVIDRAARALAGAAAGEIVLDDVTAKLLEGRFEMAASDPRRTLLLGPCAVGPEARTLLGRRTSCVGRARELALLDDITEECFATPIASAVVVTGHPGIGKTRLIHEHLASGRSAGELWTATGLAVSAASPLDMLAQLLRAASGSTGGEDPATRRRLLSARVARRVPAAEVPRVSAFLGEAAGTPFSPAEHPPLAGARDDAPLMSSQVQGAWNDLLRAECAAGGVVLVLDDLQWGDRATVRLIDGALRDLHDQPLLVLALARPEIADVFPRLWSERRVHALRLVELTPRAAGSLVVEVLGESVDPGTVARVVERAGGNAFYLEELIRSVAEDHGDRFPATVVAMAESRLSRLAPRGRHLLRAASVFGEVFWTGAVAALLGEPPGRALDALLDELADAEVIRRRGTSRFRDESELVFRHALVRDAAYAMLVDADRVVGHRLAGAWLEEHGESDPVMLAEHFERGGLLDRAADAYRRAAVQAQEAADFTGAMAHAGRAIALGAGGRGLGEVRLVQAETLGWEGRPSAEHLTFALDALDFLPPSAAERVWAAHSVILAAMRLGRLDAVERAVAALETSVADRSSAHVRLLARVVSLILCGDAHPLAERLFAILEEAAAELPPDPAGLASLRHAHGVRANMRGQPEPMLRDGAALLAALEASGHLRDTVFVMFSHAWAHAAVGQEAEARRLAARIDQATAGLGLAGPFARLFQAMLATLPVVVRGLETPAAELDGATAAAEELAPNPAVHRRLRGFVFGTLAVARAKRGDLDGALQAAELGLAASGGTLFGDALCRLVRVEVQRRRGETEAARRGAREAAGRLRAVAAEMASDVWRRGLLAQPVHARLLDLAGAASIKA